MLDYSLFGLRLEIAHVFLLFIIFPEALALRTTPGSPCAGVCHTISTNTTPAEIVCVDSQYNTTTKGVDFQKCISCELESTFQDPTTGETDVSWGLYNLRYAFTSCVFGYPQQVVNMSSPCVVSCQPLSMALEFNMLNPSALNFNTFCGVPSFGDNTVNQCEFCYNLTSNQVYMANFIEAVRYNCHFLTPSGSAFAINPTRIFSQSALPSSTAAYTTSTSSASFAVKNLTLLVALPILGFVLIVCLATICCFFFIRRRRKRAKRDRQPSHLHARWNDTTMSTPVRNSWGQYSPYQLQQQQQQFQQQQLQQQQQQQQHQTGHMSAQGYGPGFAFVDSNGQQQNVGFSKTHYVEVMEDSTTHSSPDSRSVAPTTVHSSENDEKTRYPGQSFFHNFSASSASPPPQSGAAEN